MKKTIEVMWKKMKERPLPLNQRYGVQFTFPCEDPLDKVSVTLKKGIPTFQVPSNHPLAHTMGLSGLVRAVKFAEKLDLSTDPNNTIPTSSE